MDTRLLQPQPDAPAAEPSAPPAPAPSKPPAPGDAPRRAPAPPEPRRLAFKVEYDGTGRHGWQVQEGLDTIAGALELALADLLKQPVRVDGASRTDAGVHARDQLAAATIQHKIRPGGFIKGLNQRLPSEIAVRDAVEVPLHFSPRFANQGKTYCYRIYISRPPSPLIDRYAWRIPWALDRERLMEAAGALVGERDFESFAAANGSHTTSTRRLYRLELSDGPRGVLELRFTGSGFLKQMIRNLVGTLVEIGRGRWAPERIPDILAARDRRAAGPTAPARGLELERMHLGPSWATPAPPPPRVEPG